MTQSSYIGRIAPTPTGYLHLGHGRTFSAASQRACARGGALTLRIEDLDAGRCKPPYTQAILEDLAWLGLTWDRIVHQRDRRPHYLGAWERLRDLDLIYPCKRSRRDVRAATQAPHAEDNAEPLFPPQWRPAHGTGKTWNQPAGANWRFRVPDGAIVQFHDALHGLIQFTAGHHFGDFVVWRRDDVPAYELAVVVDDAAMGVTEIVRGDDLLLSTARQLLLYQALNGAMPGVCHLPLVLDENGQRLAKRHDPLSMRDLRLQGLSAPTALAQIPPLPQHILQAPPVPSKPAILSPAGAP